VSIPTINSKSAAQKPPTNSYTVKKDKPKNTYHHVKTFKGSPAINAALIAAAQEVEHYEMATYGCLHEWAESLGSKRAASILKGIRRVGREDKPFFLNFCLSVPMVIRPVVGFHPMATGRGQGY